METGGGRKDVLLPVCFLSLLCCSFLLSRSYRWALVPSASQCQTISSPTGSALQGPSSKLLFQSSQRLLFVPQPYGARSSLQLHLCDSFLQGLAIFFHKVPHSEHFRCANHTSPVGTSGLCPRRVKAATDDT